MIKATFIAIALLIWAASAAAQVAHPTTPDGPEARVVDLASRLVVTFGLKPEVARLHAEAAVVAELPGLPAEVLLATASVESSFRHKLHGRLKTARGISRFCGVLQAMSKGSRKRCVELTDMLTGYVVGAEEIAYWLDRRCGGRLTCALRGHGCGNSGVREGACARYARSVWSRLASLRSGVRHRPRPAAS